MDEQKFAPSVHETTHSHAWMFVLLVGCIALIIALLGLFAYKYYQPQIVDEISNDISDINYTETEEFDSLLYFKNYYDIPFGAAEIEAYYTTVEKGTTLESDGPTVICQALVIVDGPKELMSALSQEIFGTPPTIVIGSDWDGSWGNINKSTEDNPAKILVTLNPIFEGEAVGCMSWVFDSLMEIK